jgi:hypothetical protein
VGRAKVASHDALAVEVQFAVPPAEPAVVDADAGTHAAAELDGETIDGDFARGCQSILAEKLDLHGRGGGETSQRGKVGAIACGRYPKKRRFASLQVMICPPERVSRATPNFLEKKALQAGCGSKSEVL